MPSYPPPISQSPGAVITHIDADSPFDDAGFTPGCIIHSVDGEPLRDIIDWRWLTGSEDEVLVGYTDTDGDAGEVLIGRNCGEQWGVEFDGLVFDSVKTCCNVCTFCFMRQLPSGMRAALSVRDDDYRLSFLTGTFVTLTNITLDDEDRIVRQNLSPLRFSLHAVNPLVRNGLIGPHASHGLEVFHRLANSGIRFDVQVVLVPGVNDGAVLDETLAWAATQPAIETLGVVPLGYTRHQALFKSSFDEPGCAAVVLGQIEAANMLRSDPWAFAADEFYLNAYGAHAFSAIPPASHYGDYPLFEDGIGMVRTYVDDWKLSHSNGLAFRLAETLQAQGACVYYVYGEAMRPLMDALLPGSPLDGCFIPLFVPNNFFGGNVTVTGLLVAQDIMPVLRGLEHSGEICVPRVLFNDAGVTLDNCSAVQLGESAGQAVHVVSCNPSQFLQEILTLFGM